MPYKGEAFRVLSGSVNLNPPGSEIGPHEAQKLLNCTYDANGNIRSRKGHTSVCSASNVSQMLKALGSRWQAVNLARITAYQQFVIKVGPGSADKDCGPVITNSGPRKSTGSNDWSLGIEAPTTKPDAMATDTPIELLSGCDGWDIDPTPVDVDGVPLPDFDDSCGPWFSDGDETYALTKDVSANLKDGHSIDDVHKITLWCKQWKKVEGVSFEVDVNAGDFTTDCYVCKMPLVNKIIGKRDEAVFYVRARPFGVDKGSLDKKRYGHFERIGSTPGKDWGTVTRLRIKIDFSEKTKFRLPGNLWQVVGDDDNVLEGDDYQVCFTYVNDQGQESNPSPLSDAVVCNRNGIEITNMQDSPDPQVTKKHIYIGGGTLQGFWRVNGSGEDEDNVDGVTGTSYTITQGETDILTYGIELENDHDMPPDGKVVAGPYYDRILIAQDGTNPHRIWWSKQTKSNAWPGADQAAGSWNDVGMAGEKIMAITVRPHSALLYKENSVWILSGDPGDLTGDFHETAAQMGISSPNGVVKAGGVDYAHMSEGIYVFNGSSATKISQRIDPIFKGRSVVLSDGTIAQPIGDVTTTAIGFRDNVVWFSYDGSRTIKYDVESERWFQDSRAFTAFYYEGQNGTFLGALSSGSVVSLEQGSSDDGGSIQFSYLSKDYDMNSPDLDKKFEDFTIETSGNPLTLTAYLNGRQPDAAVVPLGVTTGGREVFKLNSSFGRRARTIAIGATGNVTSETTVNKLICNYYDETRQGKSYDTAVSNAGTHKVKLIRELLPSLENEAEIEFRLRTDLPGFGLTTRESHPVPINPLRRAEPIVMVQDIYAHDFQVIGEGTGYFHLFELKALVQVIGTYLHGSKGEYYLSDPLDFGSERVKLIKEIEVVYSSSSSTELILYTDLPGNAIVPRGAVSLPPTSGEQSVKIRTNGYTKGRLYQLRLIPTGDLRLEALRFYLKFIGEHGALAWRWIDLPLEKTQDAIWVPLTFSKDQAA